MPRIATGAVPAPRLGLHVHVTMEDGALTQVRLLRAAHQGEPDAEARPLLARIARHVESGREDLRDVQVRFDGVGEFHRVVLERLLAEVGPGETVTYGELARRVGSPGASRAVGAAMARNPIPLVVPCHRVLPSDGKPGNYSGEGGWETKLKLLRLERAPGFAAPVQSRLAA